MGSSRRGDVDVEAESRVKAVLSTVPEPLTGRALASLGALRGIRADITSGKVHVEVDMLVPGHPMLAAIKASCEARLREELPWVMVTLKVDLPQVTNKGEVRTSMPVA